MPEHERKMAIGIAPVNGCSSKANVQTMFEYHRGWMTSGHGKNALEETMGLQEKSNLTSRVLCSAPQVAPAAPAQSLLH